MDQIISENIIYVISILSLAIILFSCTFRNKRITRYTVAILATGFVYGTIISLLYFFRESFSEGYAYLVWGMLVKYVSIILVVMLTIRWVIVFLEESFLFSKNKKR